MERGQTDGGRTRTSSANVKRATARPGMVAGGLVALGGVVMLLTFLFMDIVDYSYTQEPLDTFTLPGEVAPEPVLREDQYKGKDVADEANLGEGAALLVWTIGAGGMRNRGAF